MTNSATTETASSEPGAARPASVEARPLAGAATGNLLLDFYDWLPRAIASYVEDVAPVTDPGAFSPGFLLPDPDDGVREMLGVATASWRELGDYRGHRVVLLDLTRNPGTHTTKTFASLLIVARAVEYVRRSGEAVMIFSPTSANKGVALRDAVLRAITAGLVSPEQLRVAALAPRSCRQKLRASRLSDDPDLRALNPQLEYVGDDPEAVKALGRDFVERHATALRRDSGLNLWYSLELRNYLIADTARAFFEQRVDPIEEAGRPRLHAHAVSSAFGLLGYHQGRSVLEQAGLASPECRPASLLVQHLGAPDMVLNLVHGDFDRSRAPTYALDPVTGLYRQDADQRFPRVTYDPDEILDGTFYSHRPVTSPAMNELIRRFGGDGIVVSLAECVERYPYLRGWLEEGLRPLPADFRTLREWSLVMALTGALNAIDRGLVEAGRDVVVHGSGSYGAADYVPLEAASLTQVETTDDLAAALLG
jgi:hypothetical protein